jgi:uncharacterized coiled-coil protein SlyX
MEVDLNKIPEGWRESDWELLKKWAFIEARLDNLEKKYAMESENISDVFKHLNDFRKDIIFLAEDNRDLTRQLNKLDEVYYHVFPDRLKQDERFEKQLEDLMPKIKLRGDADPKDVVPKKV